MNYEGNAFWTSLKKVKWWFLIYFLILLGYFYSLYEKMSLIPIDRNNLIYVSGTIYKVEHFQKISYLFLFFQIFLIILLLYIFINYEKNNSEEFIILRKKYTNLLFKKFLISIFFIIIFRVMYNLLLYEFFRTFIPIYFEDFLYSILEYTGLVSLIYLCVYLKNISL